MATLTLAHRELYRRAPDERFPSLDALIDYCREQQRESRDLWKLPAQLQFAEDDLGKVHLRTGSDGAMRLNEWSFSQVCRLASVSKDRSVKLVETATGDSKFTFGGMDLDVIAVAASPDGKAIVSSGMESGIHWWNPQTGERVRVQAGHRGTVYELCFNRDGTVLASASGDATVQVWNGTSGASMKSIPVGSLTYAVALSPDGKFVAAGSFDGMIRLFDTATGRLLVTLVSLSSQGEAADWLALTPEGYTAASPTLMTTGKWRMGAQNLATSDAVWKALYKPDVVAKAARGDTVPVPFGK